MIVIILGQKKVVRKMTTKRLVYSVSLIIIN
jgi:hypothetical protein